MDLFADAIFSQKNLGHKNNNNNASFEPPLVTVVLIQYDCEVIKNLMLVRGYYKSLKKPNVYLIILLSPHPSSQNSVTFSLSGNAHLPHFFLSN